MKRGDRVKIVAAKSTQHFRPGPRSHEKLKMDEESHVSMFIGKIGEIESVDTHHYPITVYFKPAATFTGNEQYQRFHFGEVEFLP